jgi:hypothetical protein
MLIIINQLKTIFNHLVLHFIINTRDGAYIFLNITLSKIIKNEDIKIDLDDDNQLKNEEKPIILASNRLQDKITLIKQDTEHIRNHIKKKIKKILDGYSWNISLISSKNMVFENRWVK